MLKYFSIIYISWRGRILRKAKDILGLPITLLESGKEIFSVKGILFSKKSKKVLGFLVDEGGWLKGSKIILLKNIHTMGKDVILIENKDLVMSSTQIPEVEQILEGKYDIFELEAIDVSGNKLGRIEDIIFNEKNGKIHSLEISEGVFEDILYGRLRLPLSESIKFENQGIIVQNKTGISQIGGLKKYFSQEKDEKGRR